MEGKKFWNWKTALAGVLTALILTGIAAGTYVLAGEYLRERSEASDSSAEIVEQFLGNRVALLKNGETREISMEDFPSQELLKQLYCFSFVLYRDLCATKLARQEDGAFLPYQTLYFDELPAFHSEVYADDPETQKYLTQQYEYWVNLGKNNTARFLSSLKQNEFSQFIQTYDYWVWKTTNPELVLTNSSMESASLIPQNQYAFLFEIDYDSYGVATISEQNFTAEDMDGLRRNLKALLLENATWLLGGAEVLSDMRSRMEDELGTEELEQAVERALQFQNPQNCKMVLGITWEKWQQSLSFKNSEREWEDYFQWFSQDVFFILCIGLLFLAMLCGWFYLNPKSEEKREKRILARAPLELLLLLMILLAIPWIDWENMVCRWVTDIYLGYHINYAVIVLFAFLLFLLAWYVGGNLGEIRVCGLWEYCKRRSLIHRLFAHCRRAANQMYQQYRETDLSEDLRKKIRKLVILQAVLLVLCCLGWVAGIPFLILYSVWLYYRIMKSILQVQQDYRELAHMTQEMAEGNLKIAPSRELGLFEPVKKELVQIRNGFDKAVQEEVKSHKMKTELITNVSHDLKTPLTAIITYINLLKEKDLPEETRAQYVDTLDQKALRLKTLIEDLFEVSKANSGNVQLKLQKCDLEGLIKQIYYDMEEKLKEKKLITRFSFPDEKVALLLDGEKTYRIYENLFQNIAKYAMEGTRVYVSMVTEPERVIVTLKNITKAELYVPAEELKERFVRGDASRGSVEGSGLGLAIATSFTELQGGKFDLEIDGDLFKVTTVWRREG